MASIVEAVTSITGEKGSRSLASASRTSSDSPAESRVVENRRGVRPDRRILGPPVARRGLRHQQNRFHHAVGLAGAAASSDARISASGVAYRPLAKIVWPRVGPPPRRRRHRRPLNQEVPRYARLERSMERYSLQEGRRSWIALGGTGDGSRSGQTPDRYPRSVRCKYGIGTCLVPAIRVTKGSGLRSSGGGADSLKAQS